MKRPIAAVEMLDVEPMRPATPPPVFLTVKPEELLVVESYQRDLSEASTRLIRKIVAEWDWRKFKAPVVAMTEEGPVILDGQHTATAAASHPGILEIPVLVVEAPGQQTQAAAFVGINTTRLGITAAQLHHANVTAGDPVAVTLDRVCELAGVRVLRIPPARAVYKPGETIAVAALSGMITRSGEAVSRRVLTILAGAEIGPIQAAHIRAVEHLITDPEFGDLDPDDLGRLITTVGLDAAEREGKVFASTHGVPLWRALAAIWFKARRAKKAAKNIPQNIPEPPHAREFGADRQNFEILQVRGDPKSAKPASQVAETAAQPEPKSGPICQPIEAERARHADLVAKARSAVPAPNFSGPGRR